MHVAVEEALHLDAHLAAALVEPLVRMLVDALGPRPRGTARLRLGNVRGMRFEIEVAGELGKLLVLRLVRFADDGPTFHRAMLLRAGYFVGLDGLGQLGANREIQVRSGAK